jgi:hypothetical protein
MGRSLGIGRNQFKLLLRRRRGGGAQPSAQCRHVG